MSATHGGANSLREVDRHTTRHEAVRGRAARRRAKNVLQYSGLSYFAADSTRTTGRADEAPAWRRWWLSAASVLVRSPFAHGRKQVRSAKRSSQAVACPTKSGLRPPHESGDTEGYQAKPAPSSGTEIPGIGAPHGPRALLAADRPTARVHTNARRAAARVGHLAPVWEFRHASASTRPTRIRLTKPNPFTISSNVPITPKAIAQCIERLSTTFAQIAPWKTPLAPITCPDGEAAGREPARTSQRNPRTFVVRRRRAYRAISR